MAIFRLSAAVAALIVSAANASPLAASLGLPSLFDRIDKPASWTAAGDANPDTTLKLAIGLKQGNMQGLEAKLLDVSNPASTSYGKWLSKAELESYTRPSDETVALVKQWLAAHDLTGSALSQPTPDWIEVTVPISKAESMLNTKYGLFKKNDKVVPGTLEYSLPAALHGHIDTIQPTNAFHASSASAHSGSAKLGRRSANYNGPSSCTKGVGAQCITDAYNVDYVGTGNTTLAVTGMINYSASHDDAASYLSQFFPKGQGTDFAEVAIGGASPNDPSNPTLEGDLDTQTALSVGYPAPVTYVSVGPNDANAAFGDELYNLGTWMNSADSPPPVVSSSYLSEEPDYSSYYINRICNEFMKAGSRGITVLFCSGDQGVSGLNARTSCPNGYVPIFPATCPYVTAVGATQFSGSTNAEEAVQFNFIKGGTSGGGFSNYYAAPSWQSADTKAYISKLPSSLKGKYNATGRGFPDISLVGVWYHLVLGGKTEFAEGTSAATPAWASLLTQINDYRASLGKSSLGFINQALYTNKNVRAALRDVSSGNNKGCGGNAFPSTSGWDAVTGLGSTNFAALRKALGAL